MFYSLLQIFISTRAVRGILSRFSVSEGLGLSHKPSHGIVNVFSVCLLHHTFTMAPTGENVLDHIHSGTFLHHIDWKWKFLRSHSKWNFLKTYSKWNFIRPHAKWNFVQPHAEWNFLQPHAKWIFIKLHTFLALLLITYTMASICGHKAANSMRIRESIPVMIRVASTYENQLPLLNPIVIVMVAIKFDSRKLQRNCTPWTFIQPDSYDQLPRGGTQLWLGRGCAARTSGP